MPSRSRAAALPAIVMALVVAACSGAAPATTGVSTGSSPGVAASSAPSGGTTKLAVGLGYLASVQFAPFYLADQAGYYRDAGLDVTFRHGTDYDVIALVGQGALDVGIADGTSVIPAVSQGIPIRYLATLYGKFPSIVFAKSSTGITDASDLKGRKIGIPGKYGSSWIMLQALLGSVGLTPDDVTVVEYPDYGQGAAVTQDAVEAATGYANNEPIQLEMTGEKPTVLRVDGIVPLPGPGLISGVDTIKAKHDAIAAFTAATLRAMDEITKNPQVGLDAAIRAVPELADSHDTQAAILAATIDSWNGPTQADHGLGALDAGGWATTIAYMTKLGLVPKPVTVDDVLQADLLPSGG